MNIQLDTNGNPLQINGLYDEMSKLYYILSIRKIHIFHLYIQLHF